MEPATHIVMLEAGSISASLNDSVRDQFNGLFGVVVRSGCKHKFLRRLSDRTVSACQNITMISLVILIVSACAWSFE